jgi:predicted RNA binding protein YcfA (HicA-like mRNA interferase family)
MSGKLPSLTPREVVRVLLRAGFAFHHQSGSHAFYQHSSIRTRWATVPMHAQTLKKGTLRSIIRQTGLSRDQFRALL